MCNCTSEVWSFEPSRNDGQDLRFRRMDERPWTGLGVFRHFDGDEIRTAARQRVFQRRAELLRRGHARCGHAERFRELGAIRIYQIGCPYAAPEPLALVPPATP